MSPRVVSNESADAARPGWRLLRVGAYFVLLAAVHGFFELAFRIWGIGYSLIDPGGGKRRINALVRNWGVACFRLTESVLGARADVRGQVPPGRFVAVSNHQSTADIPILFTVFRSKNCKFVVKRQLGRFIPAVSVAVSRGGFALIDRDSSRSDVGALRRMGRGLSGWDACAIVFPEGTRSVDGSVLPYGTAAVRILAKAAGLPLLPVAIDGTHVARDLNGFVRNMPGARFRVTIGEPIPLEAALTDPGAVVERIRRWTQGVLSASAPCGSDATDRREPALSARA